MYSKEDILFKALKVNEARAHRWCKKVREPMLEKARRRLNAEETKDLTRLENIWYEDFDRYNRRSDHYNDSRYYALNLHSVFYRGTVEFRCFNATLRAGRAKAYLDLCLAMSAKAIEQRSAVMRKTVSENEAFTFRVWLVRLGLNGEEFKNTREHLLANLEGNRAWRYDKDSYEVNRKKKKTKSREVTRLKIRIEEEIYEGTPREIMERLWYGSFDYELFPDLGQYIEWMANNFKRMTDMPCDVQDNSLDGRARTVLLRLADIDALEVMEDE